MNNVQCDFCPFKKDSTVRYVVLDLENYGDVLGVYSDYSNALSKVMEEQEVYEYYADYVTDLAHYYPDECPKSYNEYFAEQYEDGEIAENYKIIKVN